MFVTLVVIPLLFLYFYLKTKQEAKEHHVKWLHVGKVPEEYMVKGRVVRVNVEKTKFYHNRWVYISTLVISTETKHITVIKKEAIKRNNKFPTISPNMSVKCWGQWNNDCFEANTIEILD